MKWIEWRGRQVLVDDEDAARESLDDIYNRLQGSWSDKKFLVVMMLSIVAFFTAFGVVVHLMS